MAARSSGPVGSYHWVLRTEPGALSAEPALQTLCKAMFGLSSPLHKETVANSLVESQSTIHGLAGNTARQALFPVI